MLNINIRENLIPGNQENGIQLTDFPYVSDRIFRILRNVFLNSAMVSTGFMANNTTREDFSGSAITERVYLINNTSVGGSYGV